MRESIKRCLLAACGATLTAFGCGRIGFESLERDAGESIDASGPGEPDGEVPLNYDYCETLPSLKAAPDIDGVLDGDLPLKRINPEGWTGASALPPGHDARFAVAFYVDAVYVFADVDNPVFVPAAVDDDIYCGDSIELYVDGDGVFNEDEVLPNYGDDAIQLIFAAPASANESATRSSRHRNFVNLGEVGSEFVVQGRPGGYVLEALITTDELEPGAITSTANGNLGFNMSLNLSHDDGTLDDDICPTRDGQYFFHIDESFPEGTAQLPFANNQAMCRALILE